MASTCLELPAFKRPRSFLELDKQRPAKLRKADCAAEHLKVIVNQLLDQRDQPAFPAVCLETVRKSIAPLIDEYATRDTILLPQQDASGKSLNCILLLAAACAIEGLEALTQSRKQFDDGRRFATRNWVSWTRAARKVSPCLRSLQASRWSKTRCYFASPASAATKDEAELLDLDDAIVACFTNHEVESLPDLDAFDECYICHGDFDDLDLAFYRCHPCGIDLCACCEERRVNFK